MLCASNTTITCLYSTQWAQIVMERREYLTLCSLFSEAELPSHEYHRLRLVPCSDIDPVPKDAPSLAQQKGSDPPLQLQGWWLQIVGVHMCCFHPGSCTAASNHSGTNSTKLTSLSKGPWKKLSELLTTHYTVSLPRVSSVKTQEALSSQICPIFKKHGF